MTLRVLVVEDEAMILLEMEDLLADMGHEVATAMRLTEALEVAGQGEFDFAILDVNLAGDMSFPVADLLTDRGVPYVFATGYGSASLYPPYNASHIMHKPVRLPDLNRALSAVA